MIKTTLVHPQILQVLAKSGHHDRVLIADGNYPAYGTLGPRAELVHLNLTPGVLGCEAVLEAVLSVLPVERYYLMKPSADDPLSLQGTPAIWQKFEQLFKQAGQHPELEVFDKWGFYEQVPTPRHVLTIQTAEMAPYANILLEIGCRRIPE